MQTTVTRGDAARALLESDAFLAAWRRLHDQCPWASPLQSPEFARCWFDAYRATSSPVLAQVRSDNENGELVGLMVVTTVSSSPRQLYHVGLGQAEYQGWLCRAEDAHRMPSALFDALKAAFPAHTLHLQYLLPGMPFDMTHHVAAAERMMLRTTRRPLQDLLNIEALDKQLADSAKRDLHKRLRRIGPLRMEHLTEPDQLDGVLARIATWVDCRQAAVHGGTAFEADAAKAPFYRAMFRASGLLHASVLYAGDEIVAVNFGAPNRSDVQLGLIAHNPWLARWSPGTYLIRYLAPLLAREGFNRLDLTAGGDAYKERFATSYDEVRTLTIYPTRFARFVADQRQALDDSVSQVLAKRGITRRDARLQANKWRSLRGDDVRELIRRSLSGRHAAPVIFTLGERQPDEGANRPQIEVRRDRLEDLLQYDRWLPLTTRQAFLSLALRRVESGQRFYTVCDADRLIGIGWLAERVSPTVRTVEGATIPEALEGHCALHGCSVRPASRRRGVGRAILRAMTDDAGAASAPLFAIAHARDDAASPFLTALGFKCQTDIAAPDAPFRTSSA